MSETMYELLQQKEKQEVAVLMNCNERSAQYGLLLTPEEAKELTVARNQSLKRYQRIEFGSGILEKVVDTFCDSQYLTQDTYLETLTTLTDIFYMFKNESSDQLTDDELLTFMKEQFETVCMGDTDYLSETCLPRFARAVRSGYRGYQASGGAGEYEKFSEEQRWDKELYMQALTELCWR